MAKNYVQPGEHITVTAAADTTSGDLVVIGDLVGVALGDALTSQPLVLALKGVFTLPKLNTEAAAVGDILHTDAAAIPLRATPPVSPITAGVCIEAAADVATSVKCLLAYRP